VFFYELINGADHFGRIAGHDTAGGNIFRDHGSCTHNRAIPDGYSLENGGVEAYKAFVANDHGTGNAFANIPLNAGIVAENGATGEHTVFSNGNVIRRAGANMDIPVNPSAFANLNAFVSEVLSIPDGTRNTL
jgi:hypothetical protein